MLTMYPAEVNSPATTLASGINAIVTTIPLTDSSVLPAAPNLAAIGTGEDTETILYGSINGNNLETVTRGFQGTAKAWDSGTAVARLFTAYDHDTFKANMENHEVATTGVHGVGAGTIAKVGDIAVDANLSAAAQDAIAKKHTQGTDTALGAVGTKDPPIDADKALYRDSAAADALVTSTWTQIKAFLKTYFDTVYRLATADHTHQSAGAQAGKLDHGLALNGLADDDHPQYIKDSEFTAANDILVGTGASAFAKKTPAEILAILSGNAGATFSWNDQLLSAVKGLLTTAETQLEIAAGVITVTQMRHKVDTAGISDIDDLDTINGGGIVNLIVLRAAYDNATIVIKHDTGNIWLQCKKDIRLDDIEDSILLVWDSANSKWFDIAQGGDVSGPTASIDNSIARYDGTTGKFIQDYNSNAPTISDTGDLTIDGILFLIEQAAAEAAVAGKGQLWVKTATPNELWFTDDAGTDVQIVLGGAIPATSVGVSELGAATYDDVQDYINFFGNRTLFSGGDITAHGDADGSVAIAACTAWSKETDADSADGVFFDYAGKAKQTLTDLNTNLIYLDYNGGTPQIVVATTPVTYGFQQDHILMGVVFQQGNAVHIFQSSNIGIQGMNRTFMHAVEHFGAHRSSGLVTSDGGALSLSITPGIIYAGLNRQATTVDGSTWSYWYTSDSGATWTEDTGIAALVQSYNDITSGKVALGANRYGVHWVYVDYEGSHLHIVYGQGNYTASQAEGAGVPSLLPPIVVGFGVFVAKIINQEGTNTLTITYPWTTLLPSSLAQDHGNLAGLGDDDHPQYIKDSEFTAADEVIVGTGAGTFNQVTLAASQFLAKKAADVATNVTAAEARTILNVADGADVTGDNAPKAHKTSHENGGADEVGVGGLSGLLADDQHVLDAEVLAVAAALVHASRHESGGADQIHNMADDDDDTKIQVEESADEDIVRVDVAGTERMSLGDAATNLTANHWLFGSDAGIISLPKQSGAKAHNATERQTIWNYTNGSVRLLIDTEAHDVQNELNVTKKTGTADATEANKLHDADGGFASSDIGAWIWNTADDTYTQVTDFQDSGELDLADDIMVDTEGYQLYHSIFTVLEDGYYLITHLATWWQPDDGDRLLSYLYKNGGSAGGAGVYCSLNTSYPAVVFADLVYLVTDDYLEIRVTQTSGADLDVRNQTAFTNFAVQKVA